MLIAISNVELYLSTLRATNPVALGLFQGVSPINLLKTVEQSLGVGRDTEAPLAHFLLHHRIAATNRDTIHHFIICQHRSQLWAPVHHRISQVGDTVVHQHLLFLLLREVMPVGSREV